MASVLHIEDQDEMHELVTSVQARGHRVTRARNGEEGVQQLARTNFDVILLDLVMPVQSGEFVIEWVLANRPGLLSRILVISALSPSEQLDKLGIPVLAKPFSIDELVRRITAMISACSENSRRLGRAGQAGIAPGLPAQQQQGVMRHYSWEEWHDFVQGGMRDDLSAAMQEHLRLGCQACSGVKDLLSVHLADRPRELAFRAAGMQAKDVLLAIICGETSRFARKIFDSLLEPSPVGLRASSLTPAARKVRQLLYDAAPYQLDVRLELEQERARVLMIGQIFRSFGSGSTLKSLDVALMSGTDALLETVTNAFGEFQMEYQTARDLVVVVKIGPREAICMALPDLTSSAEGPLS